MSNNQNHFLGKSLKVFFTDYLPILKGMSGHTILSYRDSLKLFLQFLAGYKGVTICKLQMEDIGVDEILAFLDHLETTRHNGVGTRNIRLSALHSFFRYLATMNPGNLEQAQRILNVPFKRASNRSIEYMEFEEITAVLRSIDRSKSDGRRDYILLYLMFNTGARVQEIVDLKAKDIQLFRPFSIRIFGKGRKERICPLWDETVQLLREYFNECAIDPREPVSIFMNHLGLPLTRFGIRYILSKYVRKAALHQPSLKRKRLHPHSMRHSTAFSLLKSGVDLITIANWLGHARVNTTNKYVTLDMEMKRQAMAKSKPLNDASDHQKSWKLSSDIIAWLESL